LDLGPATTRELIAHFEFVEAARTLDDESELETPSEKEEKQ
jgi:hypothetical protein